MSTNITKMFEKLLKNGVRAHSKHKVWAITETALNVHIITSYWLKKIQLHNEEPMKAFQNNVVLLKNAFWEKQTYLWNPESTHHMCPAGIVRLFESTSLVGTEGAVHSSTWWLQAAPTEPLTLRDVGHTVALLVYGQITHVTEEDHVAVLTLAIITDTADSIFIDEGTGVCLGGRGMRVRMFYICARVSIYDIINS